MLTSKDPYFKDLLDKESYDQKNILMKISSLLVQSFRNGVRLLLNLRPKRCTFVNRSLIETCVTGREFYPINPLVDLYNSVSLAYAIPCGGEDMEKIAGGLSLGKAKGRAILPARSGGGCSSFAGRDYLL